MKNSPSVKSSKTFLGSRAPRVVVPNRERVSIAVGREPAVIGTMCKLSTTGGSIRLNKFFAEGAIAEITLETTSGKMCSPIQFLRRGVDGIPTAQAFSFVHMDPSDHVQLATIIDGLRAEGFGDSGTGVVRPLRAAARRALAVLHSRIG